MTEEARALPRARLILVAAVFSSTVWAGYWLWPTQSIAPDFSFQLHPTAVLAMDGSDGRPSIPYFEDGRFHSPNGTIIPPYRLIEDHRYPENIDSPGFAAMFVLKEGATRGDFVAAAKQIWAVCGAALYVASRGSDEMPAIVAPPEKRDCAVFFPHPPQDAAQIGRMRDEDYMKGRSFASSPTQQSGPFDAS